MGDDYFTGTNVDEDDPNGTGAGKPDHHIDGEDDDPSVGDAGHYPDAEGDVDITDGPQDRTDNHHQLTGSTNPDEETYRTRKPDPSDREWRLNKVIVVVIPGVTDYMAAALAASRLTLRTPGVNSERLPDRFQPYRFLYDLEEAPASTLTDSWGALPDVANATEDGDGKHLLETAIEKTWPDGESTVSPESSHLYGPDGELIVERDAVEELRGSVDDDESLFVVSALHLTRGSSSTTKDRGAEQKRKRMEQATTRHRLHCGSCGEVCVHSFDDYDGVYSEEADGVDEQGQPIWECRTCGAPRFGPDPHATDE